METFSPRWKMLIMEKDCFFFSPHDAAQFYALKSKKKGTDGKFSKRKKGVRGGWRATKKGKKKAFEVSQTLIF